MLKKFLFVSLTLSLLFVFSSPCEAAKKLTVNLIGKFAWDNQILFVTKKVSAPFSIKKKLLMVLKNKSINNNNSLISLLLAPLLPRYIDPSAQASRSRGYGRPASNPWQTSWYRHPSWDL